MRLDEEQLISRCIVHYDECHGVWTRRTDCIDCSCWLAWVVCMCAWLWCTLLKRSDNETFTADWQS